MGSADRLYARAGRQPEEMHFAQVFDDYPVMSFIQLEGLGICPEVSSSAAILELVD